MTDFGEEQNIGQEPGMSTRKEKPFNASRARKLMRQYDLRARQMLEKGLDDDNPQAKEWKVVKERLLGMGADPSWVDIGNTALRIKAVQKAEAEHGFSEAGRRMELVYKNYDLREPFSVLLQPQSSEKPQTVEERFQTHYRSGNQRLEREGFEPRVCPERHLVFDEPAIEGLSHMIHTSYEEQQRRDNIEEDMIILVGERIFMNGKLHLLIHGVMLPNDMIARRKRGGITVNYEKMLDEVNSCQIKDANGVPLSKYEVVGIIHTHPPEIEEGGHRVAGELSPEDQGALQKLDSLCPGFVMGAVSPGVVTRRDSKSILNDIAYWDRSSNGPAKIFSMKMLKKP